MGRDRRFRLSSGSKLALWIGIAAVFGSRDAATQGRRTAAAAHVAAGQALTVPGETTNALLEMAAQASVIFAGQVEAVTRAESLGYVDVRFRIEQPLRGCPQSGVYVLREWVGLWIGRADRYRVGQRLLMLLPSRGPSGMSAPIGGMDGAIPLVATGVQPIANAGGLAPADDGSGADAVATLGVDLRWIAAHVARATASTGGAAARVVSGGAMGRPIASPVDASGASWSGPAAPLNAAGKGSSAAATANLSGILTLLRGSCNGPR